MNIFLRLTTEKFKKNAAKRRRSYPAYDENPSDLEIFRDIPYQNHMNVPLAMDIYRPADRGEEPLPVIIMVYGGGLLVGNKRSSRIVCERLARSGAVVISPQYRLLYETDAFGAIADLCAGLRTAERLASQYGGDSDRMFLIGESAGAFLSVYASAMISSEALCNAMGFSSATKPIKGLACISGMFYTAKKDILGLVYAKDMYGKKRKNRELMRYMDPEHEEVLKNLPPVIMTTSSEDFIGAYTLKYSKALEKAGHPSKLLDYGEGKHLVHAFPTLAPFLPESEEAMDRILQWLKVH